MNDTQLVRFKHSVRILTAKLVSCFIVLFCSTVIFSQTPDNSSQPEGAAAGSVQLVMDLSALPAKDPKLFGKLTGVLLETGTQTITPVDYSTIPTHKEDIYRIISAQYGFSINDPTEKFAAWTLAGFIRAANGLQTGQRLVSGKLKLPPFFSKPQNDVSYYTQLWNVRDTPDTLQLLHVDKSASAANLGTDEVGYANAVNLPLKEGSLAQTVLNSSQFTKFKELLSPSELTELLRTGAFDIISPGDVIEVSYPENFPTSDEAAIPVVNLSESNSSGSPPLLDQTVGPYYIIDFFAQNDPILNVKDNIVHSCAHGELVRAVAEKSLRQYGAESLAGKIQVKEFNYFLAPAQDKAVIDDYINNFGFSENIKRLKEQKLQELKLFVPDKKKKQTSFLYIQALYWSLLSKANSDASIISSSAFARFDFYQPVPVTFDQDSKIPILNAVLNDSHSDVNSPDYEPLRYFLNTSGRLPTVLIGATKGSTFDGMADRRKKGGVTSIGPGSWEVSAKCENGRPELAIWGASYATPAIGSMLLMAKAFWRANGRQYNGLETRRRLLLASNPREDFIGFFASAGVPDVRKLLVLDNPILVDRHDVAQEVILGDEVSTITIDGVPRIFSKQESSHGISGLSVNTSSTGSGCNAFVFFEDTKKWECQSITELSIHLTIGGQKKDLAWSDFTNTYKEIILP